MDNPQPKEAKLVLSLPEGGGREFVLPNTTVTLGRETTNDILLYDPKVSRVHTRIDFSGTSYILIDLGSANGTQVNGSRVKQAVLKPGDVIQLGDSTLRFDIAAQVSEVEVTQVTSETELETMLTKATMEMQLNDNNTPRLADEKPTEVRGLVNEIVIIPGLLKLDQYSRLTDYLKEELEYEDGRGFA